MTSVDYVFPESIIGTIDGNGRSLSRRRKGVTVTLHIGDLGIPVSAEIYDTSEAEEYADIGLTILDNQLLDYDGAFNLPREVQTVLSPRGVKNHLSGEEETWDTVPYAACADAHV
jgi:hypothetical protein